MSNVEKSPASAPREIIPQHLLNRIESEWSQMRAQAPSPRFDLRPETLRKD
ncbi:hypothetical protein ACLE20_00360 [Rhizobium sp. YIM 134829]|uniref:hypothetical protein n=1 Tax=Rhizobium sp. YIM 134829 TaxID=3390453 RepID=UPI00397ABF83